MTTQRPGPVRFLDRYFYLGAALFLAFAVVNGFSRTVDHNLIHAAPVPPFLLTIHAIVFPGWVLFFILQSALVRTHNVRIHRTIGWFGVVLGGTIPVLAFFTARSMDRFIIGLTHSENVLAFLAVQLASPLVFAVAFTLAIVWRRRPEFHRRLMLVAYAPITDAAFARWPHLPLWGAEACVDGVIVAAMVRDLIVNRRIHKVYLIALPVIIAGQTWALWTFHHEPSYWIQIAHFLVGR